MSGKIRLTRAEKVAVRLSIKSALYLRGFKGYQRAHYHGVLDGIGLVSRNLGYGRMMVRRERSYERLMKALKDL